MTYSLWVSKRHRHPGPPICATGALERIGGPSGRRQAPKINSYRTLRIVRLLLEESPCEKRETFLP